LNSFIFLNFIKKIKGMLKNNFIILLIICSLFSCKKEETKPEDVDFRQEMRNFVIEISQYAKSAKPGFLVIPQNGIELVQNNDQETTNMAYLNAIDGNGQEDLYYGYNDDDEQTPTEDNIYTKSLLDISKNAGKTILVTDYCSTHLNMDNSYNQNNLSGYISFAANQRGLNNIPNYPSTIYSQNNSVVSSLSNVQNFLYLINPENYNTKQNFIEAVTNTNYDLLIMDLFFNDGIAFSASEIEQLRNKLNGGKRLVICYMSIGEAEDYRYYWQNDWTNNKPAWLDNENPDWEGNFKVKYWIPEWKQLIFGNDNSYLKKILNAGFDGVYLDIIDGFEYFENQ
jgi:cysteinyl-tRNA synthetase